MHIIEEGKARFYASRDKAGKISKELEVFYNPVMKFNRDVTILLLNSLDMKDMQLADIMAGSGVRSLRFLGELKPGIIKTLTVNDYDETFKDTFERSMKLSGIDSAALGSKLVITQNDANKLLLDSKGFDYIDIDPFGSPNDFLESSITRLSRRGILAVTATDTAPLSGTFPHACARKYWAKPMHNFLMHEVGLRILIRKVQLVGANHERALVPIFSYFKDHYFRIFFRCEKGRKKSDEVLAQHKYVLYCNGCMNFWSSQLNCGRCSSCGSEKDVSYAGPMWVGKLFDARLAGKLASSNTERQNSSILSIMHDESLLDEKGVLGFYDIHEIAKRSKIELTGFDRIIGVIRKKSYAVSRTHFSPLALKTNMPIIELVALMKDIRS